jgi:hypothetical protein
MLHHAVFVSDIHLKRDLLKLNSYGFVRLVLSQDRDLYIPLVDVAFAPCVQGLHCFL